MTAGGTLQLAAVGKDAKGRTVSGLTFTWSTNATLLARVSASGLASAVSVGAPTIAAKDAVSGRSGSQTLSVTAPPRSAGSLLVLGSESVAQYGGNLPLSTLGIADTASTGKDHRVGIVHVSMTNSDLNPPVLRASFPQLSAVTECPNGDVYAASYTTNQGQNPADIWKVVPTTAVGTEVVRDPFGTSTTVTGMACDSSGQLLVVVRHTVGMRLLYRVTPSTRQVTLVRSYLQTYPEALAISPSGTVYATMREAFASTPGQVLVTLNPAGGGWTSVVDGQPYRLPIVDNLMFRGSRLLGLTVGGLAEVNTQTGVVSTIRAVKVP